ncbi:MAG: MerR family transcriptional regulator [Ilumatobacteraceae bacterium]
MTFSGKSAADIVGITYRQLDYWARTNLIRPTAADATGSGSRRQYTYKDLLELKVVKRLLDSGINLTSVRGVFAYMLEHVDTEISSAHIVIDGSSVVLCDGENLIDVLRHGQGVLNVLPLAGVKDEVDRRIILLEERTAGDRSQDDSGRRAV